MSRNELAAIDLDNLSDEDSQEGEERDRNDETFMPRMKSVDLRHAYSVFQEVKKVPLPHDWEATDGYGLTKELWGIIQHSPIWTIRRHKNNVPVPCFSMPPCAPPANTYSIFAGKMTTIYVAEKTAEDKTEHKVAKHIESVEEIMRVDEVSSEYNRLCCRPYHPFKLEFKQYIPLWGDSTMSSYDHLEQKETREIKEIFNQWKSSQSTASMQLGMKDLYDAQPVLFTMVRDDGQRWPYPLYTESNNYCKCLYAPSLYPCSRDGAKLYVGEMKETSDQVYQKGRHVLGNGYDKRHVGSVIQPRQDLLPMMHLRADGQMHDDDPFGKHEGPCCFGGFLEICCKFRFDIYRFLDPLPDDAVTEGKLDSLPKGKVDEKKEQSERPRTSKDSTEKEDQSKKSKDSGGNKNENNMAMTSKYARLLGCLFPPKNKPKEQQQSKKSNNSNANGNSETKNDQKGQVESNKNEVMEPTENAMYSWITKCLFPPKIKRAHMANISKRPGRKILGSLADLYADIDEYTIVFNEEEHEQVTPSQKMIIVASQLLADYNYFNGATEMCSNSEQALTCYFFYCSPYGCVQPCCCMLPKQQ